MAATVAVAGAAGAAYVLLVRGSATLDLGVGRVLVPLGPLSRDIDAPRDVVFDVIARPYLHRTPRALEQKLQVWERGADMALAAHFTKVGPLTATTLETVRFEPPERIDFRLVRGPVPHVAESFLLEERDHKTEIRWEGELGADLWALGRWWGGRVARAWARAVEASFEAIADEAERRSRSGRATPASPDASNET
jgi:hypothetical protein